ncbi:MAG: magnesium transporter [Gammaproteobacteria bacterium]
MTDVDTRTHQLNLESTLADIQAVLNKTQVISSLARRSETHRHDLVQSLTVKQQLTALTQKLKRLHPADIAFVLENLAMDKRKLIWDLLSNPERAATLLELNDSVSKSLISTMAKDALVDIAAYMDSNDLAGLVTHLPEEQVLDLLNSIDRKSRTEVQSSLSFPKDSIGAAMDFDMVSVRATFDINTTLQTLRKNKQFPEKTDQLFVVDDSGRFVGVLPIKELILSEGDMTVADVMQRDVFSLQTDDTIKDAASAFERYDLLSVPVLNLHGQLVGCLNVDEIVEYLEEASQRERLNQVGLMEEEDLYAPVWKSAKNRWIWLGLNLVTALVASRVIGLFESTIQQIVALAALMPIIASIGGNTGNQTVALMVRGLALKQVTDKNFRRFFMKEVSISIINGCIWGVVVAMFALLVYQRVDLALVMMSAMILNLVIGAFAGVVIPTLLNKMDRDPVMGSSVLLTAVTDSMGFFIFLGLAAAVLV